MQTDSDIILAALRDVINDKTAAAAARVQAARTLAEIAGLLGKHQDAPTRPGTRAAGDMSLAEIDAELDARAGRD